MATISKIVLFIIICAFNVSAATYHFSNSGNDSTGDGSIGNPYATISKAQSLTWNAGDSFLFECGSQFFGGFSTQGTGTAGSKITIGAYGTCSRTPTTGGDLGYHTSNNYPKFGYAEKVTGFSPAGTNLLWSKSDNGNAVGTWFFDHDSNKSTPSVRAAWIESHHSGCPGSMTEQWEVCYNSAFSTVYVRTTSGDPDNLGGWGVEKVEKATSQVFQIDHKHITLDRINITKFRARGITIRKPGFTFNDSGCDHNYWRYNLDPAGAGGGGQCVSIEVPGTTDAGYDGDEALLFKDCWLFNIGRDAFDAGRGPTFDGDFTVDGCHFRGTWNHGPGLIGINTPAGESFDGVITFKNNEFESGCGGLSYGCCGDSPGVNSIIFENNYFHNNEADDGNGFSFDRWDIGNRQCGTDPGFGGSNANGNTINATFRRNVFADNTSGLLIGGAPSNSSVIIEYNTFFSLDNAGLRLNGIDYPLTIRGNAFINTGSSSQPAIYCQDCLAGSLSITRNYFDPGNSSNIVIRDHAGTTRTLSSAISALSYFDSTNIGNNFGSRPASLIVDDSTFAYNWGSLFLTDNEPGYLSNMAPGSGSALIDSGGTACTTFTGAACDIGGIESGTEPDPPEPTVDSAIIRSATPTLFEFCVATANPPILPATGCTGITLNGTAASPSSCVRNGSNNKCMDVTLDQEPGPTDTITMDYSQASGNITDSVPTELAETSGFAVINNVGDNLLDANVCTSPDTFAADHELANSFDGSTSNAPGSSSGCNCDAQFVVTCNLGAAHDIGIARIFGDAGGTWYCQNYTLEHSLNGADWTTFVSTTSCFGNQWWEQDLNSLSAQYLRWTITGNTDQGRTQWTELEAYGSLSSGGEEPPPPPPPPILKQGRTGATEVGVKAN